MRIRTSFARWAVLGVLAIACAGIAMAQSTVTEIKTGEVLWVQGNNVVIKGPDGVKEFLVDDDVRFNLNNKEVSVHELKPGYKIAAVVKTTTTPIVEYTTEVRDAEVVNVLGSTIVVKNANGEYKKFTADDLAKMHVTLSKGGKSVTAYDLRKGDRVSAMIITPQPPVMVTEKEALVAVSAPPPPPPPAPVAVKVAQVTPPPPPPPPAAEPKPKKLPKTGSPLPLIGLAAIAALSCGALLTLRRRTIAAR